MAKVTLTISDGLWEDAQAALGDAANARALMVRSLWREVRGRMIGDFIEPRRETDEQEMAVAVEAETARLDTKHGEEPTVTALPQP